MTPSERTPRTDGSGASSDAPRPPIRVLIVEDRPVARKLIEDQLDGDADLQVAGVARDGDEAIEMVRSKNPDVVLMDVVMPGKDGIQTLVEIRSFSEVPIILLTGAQVATDTLEYVARKNGADAFFLKPSGNISLDLHTIHGALVSEIRRLARTGHTPYAPMRSHLPTHGTALAADAHAPDHGDRHRALHSG